jgi:hypothetical protein
MTRDPVVVVPADLDVEDRIVGPVTFRMAGWLAAAVVGVALVVAARGDIALTIVGVVLAAVGVAGAWLRPGGRPLGAWVVPLLAFRRRRRASDPPVDESPVETAQAEPPVDAESTNAVPLVEVRPTRPARAAAVVVAGVLSVAVLVGVAALRLSPRPTRAVPAPPSDAATSQRSEPSVPVVVVVPVDPFVGWEVSDDDGLVFGCGC